jgi:hypothetical protein
MNRSAVVTVAFGHPTEQLDYTFASFGINEGVPLHAFILGKEFPGAGSKALLTTSSSRCRTSRIRSGDLFSPDRVERSAGGGRRAGRGFVRCALPAKAAAVREHPWRQRCGGLCRAHGRPLRHGPGYTANFLNGGVFFWKVAASQDIRAEIVARGRRHFRTVADDQFVINEVVQTKHYDRLRILPCQYNYRAYLNRRQRGWPTVTHLDGVLMYHNATCMEEAKKMLSVETPGGFSRRCRMMGDR